MSNIGTMTVERDDDGELYAQGYIKSLQFKGAFRMGENRDARGDGSPTHLLYMSDGDDGSIQVGVAWAKELKRGDFIGMNMYSLSFDEPSLPEWMGNIAAFPDTREGEYNIVHNRKKQAA